MRLFPQSDCVTHGDLECANILCEPQIGEIMGIIVWAEVSINSPVFDYSALTPSQYTIIVDHPII